MIKKIFIVLTIVICLLNVFSSVVLAADGLVQCGTGSGASAATDCDFAAAVAMINRLINYLIMIAVPIAAVAFAYAGWLYLSSGGNTGQVEKAKEIFTDVGIGFIIVLSGWLVFTAIAKNFLNPSAGYGTYLN